MLLGDGPMPATTAELVLASEGVSMVRPPTAELALKTAARGGLALVVLDVNTLGDEETLRIAQGLRALPATMDVPILLLAPEAWPDASIERAVALGQVDCLPQPWRAPLLRARLDSALALHRARLALYDARQQGDNDRAFLAAVLESVEDAIVACDADGRLTLFNRASRELHGLTEAGLPQEEWSAYYALFQADGFTPLPLQEIPLLRALGGEKVSNAEMVVRRRDGRETLLSASGRPLIDAAGARRGAVVSMHDVTALREAQQARETAIREHAAREKAEATARVVRESTERFELLLNSSAEGIIGMAADGTCTFVNNAGASMLGYAAGELVGRSIHDMLHRHRADGRPCAKADCRIQLAMQAGSFVRVEDEVFWHRNGGAVPVSYSVNPMAVAGGHGGSVITFTDVTEHRLTLQALRDSNERTQLAADAAGLGLFTWEMASDSVIWHNDRPYDIFGIPRTRAPINAAQFAAEFVHPDDAAGFAQATAATVQHGEPLAFDVRIRRPDGELRWVAFTGRLSSLPDGMVSHLVGTAADITARKQAEKAVRQSEARLRQLANTIPNLAWMADSDGAITWYNDRWHAYTGKSLDEMAGGGWQCVHDPAVLPGVIAQWTASIQSGAPFEMTFPLRGADGVFRPFYTLVAPLRDAKGRVVQWFGTNTDVTALKRAEADLRETDRRKDDYLAMLAHELRNPLAPIRNAAEILRRLESPEPRVRRAAEIIARQVGHMAGLLNDLLDVSRVTRGAITLDKAMVDIAATIADAVEQTRPLLEHKQHQLAVRNDVPGARVCGSALRLTQVVANLLDNAAKYSPPRSAIGIEITLRPPQLLCIAVSDNGVGISAELLPHVFEPFIQAERSFDRSLGGLGLGLAVVKGLAELHGGTVSVQSDGVAQGSRFVVELPLFDKSGLPGDDAALAPADADADADAGLGGGLDVLVVDDNVDAAESLADLLQAHGHRTVVVHTAGAALEAARSRHFHFGVFDIGLPDLTGYELARRIRAASPVGPVLIALTGYGQADDRAESAAAGFARHLVKPVDPHALLACLGA